MILIVILLLTMISLNNATIVSRSDLSNFPGCPIGYAFDGGGDCIEFEAKYPDCDVKYKHWIGDSKCNSGEYNTPECGYDGGDCTEFNNKYPDCKVSYPYIVGDKSCFGKEYNTRECGYDGGDCAEFNRNYPDCKAERPYLIGDGKCHDVPGYNTLECGEF